jgi:hypothetical protein
MIITFMDGKDTQFFHTESGVLGLRPMDGVACGQKSGKILIENLRK